MSVAVVGIDLAKTVFQAHGVDEAGRTVLRRRLGRSELLSYFAKLPACLIGMEACSSAHHLARELIKLVFPVSAHGTDSGLSFKECFGLVI